jgi:hypothetical protein
VACRGDFYYEGVFDDEPPPRLAPLFVESGVSPVVLSSDRALLVGALPRGCVKIHLCPVGDVLGGV